MAMDWLTKEQRDETLDDIREPPLHAPHRNRLRSSTEGLRFLRCTSQLSVISNVGASWFRSDRS